MLCADAGGARIPKPNKPHHIAPYDSQKKNKEYNFAPNHAAPCDSHEKITREGLRAYRSKCFTTTRCGF